MKLRVAAKKKARIEIIPMIDTMFFLLVFFMVATLSMTIQHGMTVNLPAAATGQKDQREVVSLTVTKTGELFYNKEAVASIAEVSARLRALRGGELQPSVLINADEETAHGRIVEVMDAVRQGGVTKMAIATKPVGRG